MTLKFLKLAALSAASVLCFSSCGETVKLVDTDSLSSDSDSAAVETTEIPVTEPTTEPFSVDIKLPRNYKPAQKSIINGFETVLQCPELPTGCEITALCQTLNFLGFDIDKVDLSDEFLPVDFEGVTTMDHAYIGDPKSDNGFGCMPPVIVQTADDYFKSINSPCYAVDLSDLKLEKLFYQIEQGRPVVVWTTINLVQIQPVHYWDTEDGEEFSFNGMQHCVTLYGFDLERNIVNIADPLVGNVEYDLDRFEAVYEHMGKKAVVICGDSDTEGSYYPEKDYKRSKFISRNALDEKNAKEEEEKQNQNNNKDNDNKEPATAPHTNPPVVTRRDPVTNAVIHTQAPTEEPTEEQTEPPTEAPQTEPPANPPAETPSEDHQPTTFEGYTAVPESGVIND